MKYTEYVKSRELKDVEETEVKNKIANITLAFLITYGGLILLAIAMMVLVTGFDDGCTTYYEHGIEITTCPTIDVEQSVKITTEYRTHKFNHTYL